ncbi:hypothetical protein FQV39_20550 [Bosea sp. F3-2]|uniref:hypothetical protein n=1 Tax=Bosea sp. F3-2 TaxID=2599640 RepID=UPI0011ED4F56|nr:hypothetical protein [Bosea sp. F3-2]QEL24708.1 hypothetical protein FQV39_20550 [Bosea sp. F3-2]
MPTHRHSSDRGSELRTLRLRLLRLRHELGLIRRDHWRRKYNPDQPRVPAGGPGGGQWTSGGGGGGGTAAGNPDLPGFGTADGETGWSSLSEGWSDDGTIFERIVGSSDGSTIQSEYAASRAAGFDERQTVTLPGGDRVSFETTDNVQTIRFGGPDGDLVGRTIWTPSGPEPDATVQPAFHKRSTRSTITTGGAVLFNWQSPLNGSDGQQAVMGFNSRDYRPGDSTSGRLDLSYSGRLSNEEVELACRRWPEVRELVDRAANAAGSPDLYPSRTVYGTDVHSRFRDYVRDLNDPYFKAERSFLKERIEGVDPEDVPYGYPRSIRVDAYEYRQDGTLCVYDLKTGRAGLSDRRADILANAARLGFNPIRRIVVLEVRPRR